MNDTQQEFEKAVSDAGWASNYQGDGQYAGVTIPFAWKMWQACQKLNDARINTLNDAITEDKIVHAHITSLESHNRELLAVIAAKDEALAKVSAWKDFPETGIVWPKSGSPMSYSACYGSNGERDYMRGVAIEALAIKPGDVAMVEVGYASEPSIQNLINGNDVIVGKKNDIRTEAVYALQKKEG